MSAWWVHREWEDFGPVFVFAHVFWVIMAIVLHELAHGYAAIWQGDDTPRRLDRMTLNPLVHMGPASLLVFAVIGMAWGVMPVNPSNFRWRRYGRIVVAAAGPAMNVLLALLALVAGGLVARFAAGDSQTVENLIVFLFVGMAFNIQLAIFNLLPIPPLDGSAILGTLWRRFGEWCQHPYAAFAGLAGLLIFFRSGLDSVLFGPPIELAMRLQGVIAGG